jgi:hypothetical protein
LEVEAKLAGIALSKGIELCEMNLTMDLNGLREMEALGKLKEIFPQMVIQGKIEQALKLGTRPHAKPQQHLRRC